MQHILIIDTAVGVASVALTRGGAAMDQRVAEHPREAAAWLTPAIHILLKQSGVAGAALSAVACVAGPGSYTGLRVGMSVAKALCYAWDLPLITLSTLEVMAAAARNAGNRDVQLCPMIDARRMEVYSALYAPGGEALMPPCNLVLERDTFSKVLDRETIVFFGDGADKFKTLTTHSRALFAHIPCTAADASAMADHALLHKQFADIAYAQPEYGKAFYSTAKPLKKGTVIDI